MRAFVERYPKASVWVSPGQYGPFGTAGLTASSARLGYSGFGLDFNVPVGLDWAAELGNHATRLARYNAMAAMTPGDA